MKIFKLGLLIVLCAILLGLVFSSSLLDKEAKGDFIAYWAAARLLVTGGNPYDPASLCALERGTYPISLSPGATPGQGLISWNPPWLLLVLSPFALLPFETAARLMLFCNLILIAGVALTIWRHCVGTLTPTGMVLSLLTGLLFVGSLLTLHIGQISILVLTSLFLSLWLLQKHYDGLAGAILLLTTIKPHLVYFVFLLLGVWGISKRRWRFFGGFVLAGVFSGFIVFLIFPGWLASYLALVGGHSFSQYSTSTIGGLVYELGGGNWARFVGILLLSFVPRFLRLVDTRGWLLTTNLALLISLPLSPYGFAFDQVVLVPAVVQLVAWVWLGKVKSPWNRFVVTGLIAVYGLALWLWVLHGVAYHWFVWIPLALAGLYGMALNNLQTTFD